MIWWPWLALPIQRRARIAEFDKFVCLETQNVGNPCSPGFGLVGRTRSGRQCQMKLINFTSLLNAFSIWSLSKSLRDIRNRKDQSLWRENDKEKCRLVSKVSKSSTSRNVYKRTIKKVHRLLGNWENQKRKSNKKKKKFLHRTGSNPLSVVRRFTTWAIAKPPS